MKVTAQQSDASEAAFEQARAAKNMETAQLALSLLHDEAMSLKIAIDRANAKGECISDHVLRNAATHIKDLACQYVHETTISTAAMRELIQQN